MPEENRRHAGHVTAAADPQAPSVAGIPWNPISAELNDFELLDGRFDIHRGLGLGVHFHADTLLHPRPSFGLIRSLTRTTSNRLLACSTWLVYPSSSHPQQEHHGSPPSPPALPPAPQARFRLD